MDRETKRTEEGIKGEKEEGKGKKIEEGRKEGRKKARKGERKEGKMEGRNMEGKKEGRKYNRGRKDKERMERR